MIALPGQTCWQPARHTTRVSFAELIVRTVKQERLEHPIIVGYDHLRNR